MLLGFTLFISVFILIPLSIIGKQVFVKDVGMVWLDTFASNSELVSQTVDGIFDGIATSKTIDDPEIRKIAQFAADSKSPFGSALRQVLTPESIRVNLLTNANAFYNWLASDSVALDMKYTLGGSEVEVTNAISAFLRVRYDGLTACTTAERKDLGKVDADNLPTVPCSIGSISSATFTAAAKKMTSTSEAKEILKKGIPIVSYTEGSEKGATAKAAITRLKKVSESGLFLTWCLITFGALLMALLFTPMGINFISSGVIIGTTGLSVASLGMAISNRESLFSETLGRPIMLQGVYVIFVGVILVGLGIWQLMRGGKDSGAEDVKSKDTVDVKKAENSVTKTKTIGHPSN